MAILVALFVLMFVFMVGAARHFSKRANEATWAELAAPLAKGYDAIVDLTGPIEAGVAGETDTSDQYEASIAY